MINFSYKYIFVSEEKRLKIYPDLGDPRRIVDGLVLDFPQLWDPTSALDYICWATIFYNKCFRYYRANRNAFLECHRPVDFWTHWFFREARRRKIVQHREKASRMHQTLFSVARCPCLGRRWSVQFLRFQTEFRVENFLLIINKHNKFVKWFTDLHKNRWFTLDPIYCGHELDVSVMGLHLVKQFVTWFVHLWKF